MDKKIFERVEEMEENKEEINPFFECREYLIEENPSTLILESHYCDCSVFLFDKKNLNNILDLQLNE